MSGKRVGIALKPGVQRSADAWVGVQQPASPSQGAPTTAPVIKRLTIDISEELHRRLKVKAATEGVRMADLVRVWISERCD